MPPFIVFVPTSGGRRGGGGVRCGPEGRILGRGLSRVELRVRDEGVPPLLSGLFIIAVDEMLSYC